MKNVEQEATRLRQINEQPQPEPDDSDVTPMDQHQDLILNREQSQLRRWPQPSVPTPNTILPNIPVHGVPHLSNLPLLPALESVMLQRVVTTVGGVQIGITHASADSTILQSRQRGQRSVD